MSRYACIRSVARAFLALTVCAVSAAGLQTTAAWAGETFVIAASPSLKDVLERLGDGFERSHAGVKVQLFFASGLSLRQTIAGMENSMVGQYFIGSGPINLVAPGGDELITRLEGKYYVLPDGKRPYAADQLVLVVPESLVDAPDSLDAISRGGARLAVADRSRTRLGAQTDDVLRALQLHESMKGRVDVATDSRGVVDHVLSGQADVGIIYGHEAVGQQQRLRVAAIIQKGYQPTVHSMAMERYCPNRPLCEEFLSFIQGPDGQAIVRQAGYSIPAGKKP
ncbi:MAG: Molybdenum ABC transporter, periplasmic molybdenum-binding protein ModA [Nitrospira sp.]|nr:MAG: Molybdenum ABC transporter, periplasmic molybdenum-binding protein ModA [Nitrospira sp.]